MVATVSFVKFHACPNMPQNVTITYVHYSHDFLDDEMIEDRWEKIVGNHVKAIKVCPYCHIKLIHKGENK